MAGLVSVVAFSTRNLPVVVSVSVVPVVGDAAGTAAVADVELSWENVVMEFVPEVVSVALVVVFATSLTTAKG